MAPSMVLAIASQSEATIPLLRKRKVATPDASVTSSGTIPISALIENVDMEDLIKVYQVAQKHNPICVCVQEFLTHVSLYILFCFYFFIAFLILQFMLNVMLLLFCLVIALPNVRLFNVIRLEHTVLVAISPLPRDIQGLICSLWMPLRTSKCLESPIPWFPLGRCTQIITSRHFSHLHIAISMMMRLSSSSTPPNLKF